MQLIYNFTTYALVSWCVFEFKRYINCFGPVQECKNQYTSLSNDVVFDVFNGIFMGIPLCFSNFKILSEQSLRIY